MKVYGEYTTSLFRALDEIDENWPQYDGLIVAGTHTPTKYDSEEIISEIWKAWEKTPALLICFGHQLGAVAYARHVLGIKDATSQELGKPGTQVVKYRGQLKVGLMDEESYWNNYEVDCEYKPPKHFVSTQFHPEYQSAIDRPHPLLVKFLKMFK